MSSDSRKDQCRDAQKELDFSRLKKRSTIENHGSIPVQHMPSLISCDTEISSGSKKIIPSFNVVISKRGSPFKFREGAFLFWLAPQRKD